MKSPLYYSIYKKQRKASQENVNVVTFRKHLTWDRLLSLINVSAFIYKSAFRLQAYVFHDRTRSASLKLTQVEPEGDVCDILVTFLMKGAHELFKKICCLVYCLAKETSTKFSSMVLESGFAYKYHL